MANERDAPTLADWIVLALNPFLVMVLVGSLVYFLLEVCYAGAYGADMRWTLFFFVMACVLIARVSMTGESGGRVGCYAPMLGLAVWLAMQKYIQYPADGVPEALRAVLNLGLIGVVWWCAHRLTWDCTYVGDDADRGGEGLLSASGLSEAATPVKLPEPETEDKPAKPAGWLERYRRYREERKKKRIQGIWVIWFSLAALPLFGLGQSLIPVDAEDRRRYVFWLMTEYVGAGLGLLLTTSFLGLRRYLRQRKLKMPPALASVWLTTGIGLIAVLLFLGAFLPRPHSEYSFIHFNPAGSGDLDASDYAVRGDNAGKGKGRPGGDTKDDKDNDQSGNDGSSRAQEKGSQDQDSGGDKNDKAKNGDGKDGSDKGKNGDDKDGDKKGKKAKNGDGKDGDQKGKSTGQKGRGKSGRSSGNSGALQQSVTRPAGVPRQAGPDPEVGGVRHHRFDRAVRLAAQRTAIPG